MSHTQNKNDLSVKCKRNILILIIIEINQSSNLIQKGVMHKVGMVSK